MRIGVASFAAFGALSLVVAGGCSGGNGGSGFGDDGGPGGTSPDGAPSPDLDGGTPPPSFGDGGGGLDASPCIPDPANYDIPGNGCDDDGDGKVDNVTACDDALSLTGPAADFVKAMGLCQTTTAGDRKWGVVSASYAAGHSSAGAPADGQHGILTKFGNVVAPREGKAFGVLSSGWAREYDGDGATSCTSGFLGSVGCFKQGVPMTGQGDVPTGFPAPSPPCTPAQDVYDVINLKLQIKVPANAKGLQYDFDFWSGEWPEYVCTTFNDGFIAYLQSAVNGGPAKNISYDAKNNPVSVNNGFFDRCTPSVQTGCRDTHTGTSTCPGGTNELQGTGFWDPGKYCMGQQSSGGGATGWLTTQSPVQPAETITLEFIIWDTGDANYDSSVILDNFQWIPGNVGTGTVRPPR